MLVAGCSKSPPAIAGGKSVEHWLSVLRGPDAKERIEAVRKLGNIGTKDKAALPAAFTALTDPEPAVRKEAIFVAVRNRRGSGPAMPVLARMKTEDPDSEIRRLAEEAHGNLTH